MLIYLSYRNEDSFSISEEFKTQMIERFGNHRLRMDAKDQESIGRPLKSIIRDEVAFCDLMIVLIGPEWLIDSNTGENRLESPDDIVRMEVEVAQQCEKRIVPVLIKGAKMPPRDYMPMFMRDIYKHAPERISPRSMQDDVYLLLEKYTSKHYIQEDYVRTITGWIGQSKAVISGVLIAAIALQVFSLINSGLASQSPTSTPIPTSIPNMTGMTKLGYYFGNALENVDEFAFNPDGRNLAVIGDTNEASLWNFNTGKIQVIGSRYQHLVFHRSEPLLFLSSSDSRFLSAYSINTHRTPPAYDLFLTPLNGSEISPKLDFDATGDWLAIWDTHSVSILNVGSKAILHRVKVSEDVLVVAFGKESLAMIWVMNSNGLYLWHFTQTRPAKLEEMLVCEGCTPRDMVVDTEKGVVYYLYDDAGQSKIATVSQQNGIETVINEPLDAQYINLNSAGGLIVAGNASQMVFWTTTDWQVSAIVSSDGDPIVDVEFSPQGDLLAVLDSSGTLTLWGVED